MINPNFKVFVSTLFACLLLVQSAIAATFLKPDRVSRNVQYVSTVVINNSDLSARVKAGLSNRKVYSRSQIGQVNWTANAITTLAGRNLNNNIKCTNNCNLNTSSLRAKVTINGLGVCYYGWCRSSTDSGCYYNIPGGYWYNCIPDKYKNFGVKTTTTTPTTPTRTSSTSTSTSTTSSSTTVDLPTTSWVYVTSTRNC